jgi:hypothetical protein
VGTGFIYSLPLRNAFASIPVLIRQLRATFMYSQ